MSTPSRLEELQKRFDENPRRFFAPLANEYRKSGDLDRAIEICQEHLAGQPGNMNGHVVYGQALFEAGRYAEARGTFETAIELDPENLIALRHLGDIARSHADTVGARQWYSRVLDADPRNDEIIAFLAELDTTEAQSAPSAALPSAESLTPTLVMTPVRPTTPVAPLSPTPVIPMEAIVAADLPPALPDIGLMDLSMDFGTSETVTLEDPGEELLPGVISPPDELDELDAATASLDAFAAAAAPLQEQPADDAFPSFAEIGFGDEPSPLADDPTLDAAPRVSNEFSPLAFEPPPIVETPTPFVTETMAELYLSQGFRDEALEVYKQLAAQHPDDKTLKERVRSIEGGGRSSLSLETVSDDVPEETAAGDVLAIGAMFAIEPPATFNAAAPAPFKEPAPAPPPAHATTARGFFAALSSRLPTDGSAATTSDVKTVIEGGTLDTLFGNASPTATDEHAASALSTFAEAVEAAAPVIQGRPTQAAASELSLDAVFRDTPARLSASVSRQSQKLRFDQFFSPAEEAPAAAPAPVAPLVGKPGSPAELEQFQDWLTQMKKP